MACLPGDNYTYTKLFEVLVFLSGAHEDDWLAGNVRHAECRSHLNKSESTNLRAYVQNIRKATCSTPRNKKTVMPDAEHKEDENWSHLVIHSVELCQQNAVDETRIRALEEGAPQQPEQTLPVGHCKEGEMCRLRSRKRREGTEMEGISATTCERSHGSSRREVLD